MDLLNAKNFGAVGDGSTDDTHALQTAINHAASMHGTVFIPAGTYQVSTLKLKSNVGLVCSPTWGYRTSSFGGAVLRLNDPQASCLLDVTGAVGVTLNGLCLDGGNYLGEQVHGVWINKSGHGAQEDALRIERCRITRFSGDGVHLQKVWCFNVRGCLSAYNRGSGLCVNGWDGFVLDNQLSGNEGAGYGGFEDNASVTLTGNRIEWNKLGGIVLYGSNHYNITGNYIDRAGGAGIILRPGRWITMWARQDGKVPCQDITITGNILYRSSRTPASEYESTHVYLDTVEGLVMSGNEMSAGCDDKNDGLWSPQRAIIYRRCKNVLIKDNVMNNAAMHELILDLGEHDENVVVKDNIGTLVAEKTNRDAFLGEAVEESGGTYL